MKRALFFALSLALSACDWSVGAFEAEGGGDGEAPCAEELEAFRDAVFAPVLALKCVGCHNAQGPARQTRFVLTTDRGEEALVANFRATRRVARERLGGVPLLLLRPTGRHPDGHTGGALFDTESLAYHALEDFVSMIESEDCAPAEGLTCETITPGEPRLRRLSHREYENTVRDLFGVTVTTTAFVRDQSSNGFDNDGATLVVDATLGDQYLATAESIARTLMASPTRVHACATTTSPNAACIDTVVREVGARVFRRPLESTDVDRYTRLHASLTTIDAATAFERLIVAMLVSPHFLYRAELGTEDGALATLDAYEIATELSYGLTGTMPDATLRAKAADGTLLDDAVREAEARRLLATDNARATLVRFVTLWLALDRLSSVPKDAATYPEMDAALRASMLGETEAFAEHVMFEGTGTFAELLTADYSYTDARMRTHYGVTTSEPANASGYARTSLAGTSRRGVLTHASVLAVHARPNDSSPVHRGRLVRERLLCQTLPPPPPGIVAMPPALDPSLSTRARYAAHASVEPCASCHRLMDEVGFGLEGFDGIGRTRSGNVDTHGSILEAGSTTADFADTAELLRVLSESDEALDCFAREWFRFVYGLVETRSLECMLRDVQRSFRASGGDVNDLLVSLVLAPHVRVRTLGTGAPPVTMDAGVPAQDAGTPSPDASMPPPSLGVTVTVTDRWGAGYCAGVVVKNTGTAPLTWNAPITIEAGYRLSSHWSSTHLGTDGSVLTFGGVAWNATLPAGGDTNFGFCTER